MFISENTSRSTNDVMLPDVVRGFKRAPRPQRRKTNQAFACVTHSTGGLGGPQLGRKPFMALDGVFADVAH